MSAQGSQGAPSLDQLKKMGPPYPPQGAGLGGTPTNSVDTAVSAVFLALFIGSAALNMTIFQRNLRRGHKFVLSALLFGFSMARISANVMRIVWANYPRNAQIAIAANILTNAGVLLLFVVNLILSQRILRAHHPRIGWNKAVSLSFKLLYATVAAMLVMVIVSSVYSFYTLDSHVRQQLRDIQLFAVTFLAVLAFLPIPLVIFTVLLPRSEPIDHFGKKGSMRTKIVLVLFTSVLLFFGAGFRAGVAYAVRPASDPAWFHHKAAYYCVNFGIEVIVVYAYALSRFDLRFHVPNGAHKPGHYSRDVDQEEMKKVSTGEEERPIAQPESPLRGDVESRG